MSVYNALISVSIRLHVIHYIEMYTHYVKSKMSLNREGSNCIVYSYVSLAHSKNSSLCKIHRERDVHSLHCV